MTNLRIGIPSKGRLAEVAEGLLKEAGLSFRRSERTLFARCKEIPVDITFLRTDDIPVLCAEGAIDMGVVGGDLVAETGAEVIKRLDLGVGNCRLAVCVPESGNVRSAKDLNGVRIATSFPNVTRKYLKQHGADAHLVTLTGSVEIMIALGVAEAIVDLVETGSTLAANQLRILDEIGSYETLLIQNNDKAECRNGRPCGSPVGRGGDCPQLFAVGIQCAAEQIARGGENHAGLQFADD